MTVRLRWGGATDVGQLRQVNQDAMLLGPDVFVVADGMGGHQGGEVAAALAIEAIESASGRVPGHSVTELVSAVQDANDTVFARSTTDPSLSGMGTTLVAIAAVVEDGEERLAIVNVGDSRAYQFSAGELEQITDDHSLVAELVRDGRITEAEAAEHPQRNIVTRALGIEDSIPVDDFQIIPHTGDRYLLCSDGLTNEVSDEGIAAVLRTVDDPDEAARELVRQANEHGGRDNITIVIVDVVDDGRVDGTAPAGAASVPDDDDFAEDDDDTQTLLALPDDQAHRPSYPPPVPPDSAPGTASADGDGSEEGSRTVTVRSVAFVLVVVAVIGVGLYLVNDYARNTYHVVIDDGEVTIFRGRPGGVLWIDPSRVDATGIDEDDVPEQFMDDLVAGVARPSLESARRYVANVEERIEELSTTTTTTTSTTTSTTSTATQVPPTTAATP